MEKTIDSTTLIYGKVQKEYGHNKREANLTLYEEKDIERHYFTCFGNIYLLHIHILYIYFVFRHNIWRQDLARIQRA